MNTLRNGKYGAYYGSLFNESYSLSQSEMEINALYIYEFLSEKGWSLNSICAILGNMQAESSINPGRWQSDSVGSESLGYGLVQWTPSTKYTEWSISEGYTDPSEMDSNLSRIVYEVENNIQWISSDSYNMSFADFTKGTGYTLQTLTEAFLINYERPADQSESVKNYRTSLATGWYKYLYGLTTPITFKKKKRFFTFLLSVRKRRRTWIR